MAGLQGGVVWDTEGAIGWRKMEDIKCRSSPVDRYGAYSRRVALRRKSESQRTSASTRNV